MAQGKKQVIKDIQSFMIYLSEAEVYDKYITPAGQGFLDGLVSADVKFKPEYVSKEKYDSLEKRYNNLSREYQKLKQQVQKKRKWF